MATLPSSGGLPTYEALVVNLLDTLNVQPIEAPKPSPAVQLRSVRVGLREDLEVTRHLFRGEASYIIRDPLTFESQHFSRSDYEVLTRIEASSSLSQVFDSLVSTGVLKLDDEEDYYRFIMSLHRLGFLRLPLSDDKLLYRRYQAREEAKKRARLRGFLFLRIPLWNPDAFLNRTYHLIRPLFSQTFFVVWLLIISAALFVAYARWDELVQPVQGLLVVKNLPLIWITLIGLKVFHEMGHAYACKHYGGQVPEMGAFLVLFTPCAYMDASTSWGFTQKRQRIMVSLAGMYFESMIAAAAVFVWALTEDSLIRAAAYNVIFLAGVVTVLFNINPLVRYDGYYLLSDWLEIPNLWRKSTQHILARAKRILLGIKPTRVAENWRLRVTLTSYGLAAIGYRITLMFTIAAILITKMRTVGLVLSGIFLGGVFLKLAFRLTTYLWYAEETKGRRARGVMLSTLVFVVLPMLAAFVPIPSYVHASAVISAKRETVIRIKTPGFVVSLNTQIDQPIKKGQVVIKLTNDFVWEEVVDAQARTRVSNLKINECRTTNPTRVSQQQAISVMLQQNLRKIQQQFEDLTVTADYPGKVVTCLDLRTIGSFLPKGAPVATIVSGKHQARVLLTEDQIARVSLRTGDEVVLRASSAPSQTIKGRIHSTAPAGSRMIKYPALTQVGGGEIMVHPESGQAEQPYFEVIVDLLGEPSTMPPYGTTGTIRMTAEPKPVVTALARRIARFWNHLIKS